MKIIDYTKNLDKDNIVHSAYKICENANFPVTYQDVYAHLFEKDNFILKLLLNEENELTGFGVFENYQLILEKQIITMLYLSGMVIDPKCQGKNISSAIIKEAYKQAKYDLISLRTQNIAMAKSLLHTFDDNLFVMPRGVNENVFRVLKQMPPFENINIYGVIPNCYSNQLYPNLQAIYDTFGVRLQGTDALGVIIEPNQNKQKVLSIF